MQDRVIRFVVDNSRVPEDRFRELMFRTGELARDIGTVVVGPDAVKYGLIDEVGGLAQAVAKLHQLIDDRHPERPRQVQPVQPLQPIPVAAPQVPPVPPPVVQ